MAFSKKESFLLKVNYRLRQQQYELRRKALAVLDATDEWCPPKKHADSIAELGEFLSLLDSYDQKTWDALMEHAEEKE